MRRLSLLFLFPMLMPCAVRVAAQSTSTVLQKGNPIERTLSAGESHIYTINLQKDQFVQLVVDQRGIDLVVRVFTPKGRKLGEFDSPNGSEGPENVSVIAELPGPYRIEVAPLDPSEDPQSGRYEIKVVELRKATEQELQSVRNLELLNQKAIALLKETTATFPELNNAQARARFQTKAARLLWSSDEKAARKLIEQAMDSLKEFIASMDTEENYYENFQAAMQERGEIVNVLAPHDPETALDFLRSTRLALPEEFDENSGNNQELELEVSLVRQIATSDPKKAFEIAEDTLKHGYTASLSDCLYHLRTKDPDLAGKLAHDITAKLLNEKLLKRPDATYLAMNLLRTVRVSGRIQRNGGSSETVLLSADEYRDLLQKLLAEALSYSPPAPNSYSDERNAAQNILSLLKEFGSELDSYGPGTSAAVARKFGELNNQLDSQSLAWQKFQEATNNVSVENALQAVVEAPREMRDQFYQQIASRAASAGDLSRARQIINDQITNPRQRRQALRNAEQQAIYAAASKGRFDEALRSLSNIHPAYQRVQILTQIVNQIGPGQKKAAVLQLLEQARSMIGDSPVAENQEKMAALFELASAFSRFDPDRGFEIVEPLIGQFNTISAAAETLNGFGQKYYDRGEIIMTNGNALAEVSNRLASTMARLAMVNFERAKDSADRIQPMSRRIDTYLAMAQQIIESAQHNTAGRE